MPAAQNAYEWQLVHDEFDGRLIDGLPQARYLGRMLSRLAEQFGGRAWQT